MAIRKWRSWQPFTRVITGLRHFRNDTSKKLTLKFTPTLKPPEAHRGDVFATEDRHGLDDQVGDIEPSRFSSTSSIVQVHTRATSPLDSTVSGLADREHLSANSLPTHALPAEPFTGPDLDQPTSQLRENSSTLPVDSNWYQDSSTLPVDSNRYQNSSTLPVDSNRDRFRNQGKARRNRLQSLLEKRKTATATRIQAQERRTRLRITRADLAEIDARLFQELRALAARSGFQQLQSLLAQYEEVEKCREEVQLRETEYDLLENELNYVEWELKEDEAKFYDQLSVTKDPFSVSDAGSHSSGDVDDVADSNSNAQTQKVMSPSRRQLLSRLGDRNLVMEQLEELRSERAYLVEQERFLFQFGRVLDEEGKDFLRDFDSRHASLLKELSQIEEDLPRLQNSITGNGVLLFISHQFEDHIEGTSRFSSESKLSLTSDYKTDNDLKDPLLIREGERWAPVLSNVSKDPRQNSISTVGYINQWLLHILRYSAVEVQRLKTMGRLRTLQLDRERFEALVLEWWSKDDTVKMFPQARNYTARSVSATADVTGHEYGRKGTRSENVLFSVDRIAHRPRGSQALQLEGSATRAILHRPTFLKRPRHVTTLSL